MASRGRRGSKTTYNPQHLDEQMLNNYQQTQMVAPPGFNTRPPQPQAQKFQFAAQDVRLKQGNHFRRYNKQNNQRYQKQQDNNAIHNRHQQEPNKVQVNKVNMTCPRCRRFFDLFARVPLLLQCNHSMCEDCLMSKLTPEGLKIPCAECNQDALIQTASKSELHVKDHFPVNYYLVGRIYFNRMNDRKELSTLQFVPAGDGSSAAPAMAKQSQLLVGGGQFEKCSKASCKTEASLRCTDCDEVYCQSCSDALHMAAKGLQQHKISSICIAQCKVHSGNPQEFYCFKCNSNFCTYCIIDGHKDHKFKQITKLDSNDAEKFNCLLENCNEVLKRLEITHQMVTKRINKIKPKHVNQDIEKKIGKCFLDLHAKLQIFERRVVQQAASASNASLQSLRDVERELQNNIAVVTELIATGHKVSKKNFDSWQNIDLIMQRMINANKLPHSLLIDEDANLQHDLEFEFVDFADDWSEHFKLNTTDKKKYKLVTENEEVAGYTNLLDTQSDTSSISEITIGSNVKKYFIHSGEQEHKLKQEASNFKFQPELSGVLNEELMSASCSVSDFATVQTVPSMSLTRGSMENVLVTHIVGPDKIYVQLAKNYKSIQSLHAQLEYFVQKLYVGTVKTPLINKLYLVKYSCGVTNSWRRGLVMQAPSGKQECLVKLIDYGNNISVHFDDFRTINEQSATILPFAIECRLYDLLEPKGQPWDEDDATLMADMMSGSNVTMTVRSVLSAYTFEVDLKIYSTGEEFSLRDSLLFIGRGICTDADEDVQCVFTELPESSKSVEKKVKDKDNYYDQAMNMNDTHNVVIVNIVDAITLYVQISSLAEFQNKLRLTMSEYYNRDRQKGKVYAPKPGMPVAVQQHINSALSHWDRGLIVEVNQGSGTVKVLLVDLGEERTMSYEDVRVLNKQYLSYARMAIKVKLAHVSFRSEKQNEQGKNLLAKFIGQTLKMVIHGIGEEPDVILLECYNMIDLCINTQLVEQAGLKSTGFLSLMLEWQHDEDVAEDNERDTLTSSLVKQTQGTNDSEDSEDTVDESIGLKLEPVRVLNVTNPHCIYVHLSENEKFMARVTQVNLQLQKYYCTRPFATRPSWNIDDNGVAYDKKSKQYFRVLITNRLTDNQYEVLGYDFGHVFSVKGEGIGELAADFCTEPHLALKVRLYGVNPLGGKWSLMVGDFITDTVKGKSNVFVTRLKKTNDEGSNVPVVMWIREVKPVGALEKAKVKTVNVNKLLCKNGLAILSKDWELSKPVKPVPIQSPTTTLSNIPAEDGFGHFGFGKWLPPKPFTAKTFQAIATYVDEVGCIYFHDNCEVILLQDMEQSIFEHFQYGSADSIVADTENWEVGNLCTVKYHQNQKWYRGEVVGFNQDENELRVCMIDYGNVEDVKYHEISKKIMFLHVPRAAKIVRLHDIPTKHGFSTSILDMLHRLVVEKVLDITIVDEGDETTPASAFVHQGKVNVNLFMRNELKRKKKTVEHVESDVIIDDVTEVNSFVYNYVVLPTCDLFEVSIINILDTNKIVFEVIQPQTDNADFETLSKQLNDGWLEQPVLPLHQLVDDQPCIARYHVDNVWYRGRLFTRNDKMLVHFVDFGNVEAIPLNDIRVIKLEWLAHPVEQYVAVLSDFELMIEDHELLRMAANQHLSQYIETSKLAKITKRDPLSIQLFNTETRRLSYMELIDTGILKPLKNFN